MTLAFGVTEQGFVLPSQQQLLDLITADQTATVNTNIDTSSDSVVGQLNGVFTRQLMLAYEGLQVAYDSNDPDAVEGFLLTQLSALTGTEKDAASPSQILLQCSLTIGTELLAGTTLVAVQGKPNIQFTPSANYTAAAPGPQPVPFECTQAGPNEVDASSTWVITTPLTGFTLVTNVGAPATLGTDIETDPALRLRREEELEGGGAGNVDAIRAALLQINEPLGPFVLSALMLNNFTDTTDANGVLPHSTEAVIWDGAGALVNNNAIAQVLWDKGSSGIRNQGTSSGVATDEIGNPQTVFFSRVTQSPIFLAFALTARAGYVGDAAFKAQIAAICNGATLPTPPAAGFVVPEEQSFGVGASIDPYDVVMNTAGLGAQVTGLAMGFTAPGGTPGSITSTSLPIGPRQIGIFSASNITINGV